MALEDKLEKSVQGKSLLESALNKLPPAAFITAAALATGRYLDDENIIDLPYALVHDAIPHITLTFAISYYSYMGARSLKAGKKAAAIISFAVALASNIAIEGYQSIFMNSSNADAAKDIALGMAFGYNTAMAYALRYGK